MHCSNQSHSSRTRCCVLLMYAAYTPVFPSLRAFAVSPTPSAASLTRAARTPTSSVSSSTACCAMTSFLRTPGGYRPRELQWVRLSAAPSPASTWESGRPQPYVPLTSPLVYGSASKMMSSWCGTTVQLPFLSSCNTSTRKTLPSKLTSTPTPPQFVFSTSRSSVLAPHLPALPLSVSALPLRRLTATLSFRLRPITPRTCTVASCSPKSSAGPPVAQPVRTLTPSPTWSSRSGALRASRAP